MARRNKKEETPVEEPGAEATPAQQPVDPNIEATLTLDPRRADVRRPKGAPEGFVPPTTVPRRSSRASTAARRNSRVAAAAEIGTRAALEAAGVTDQAVIDRATSAAVERAVAGSKQVGAPAASGATATTEGGATAKPKETKEERAARRAREADAKKLADMPEDQRKLVIEGREKTRQITTDIRGATVVGGELLSRAPGVDIGDVLSTAPAQRSTARGLERMRALSGVMSGLPSNSLVSRYEVARNMLNQGMTTERGRRMIFGDIGGTPAEIQKAFDTWSKTSLTNFENPDLFNRHALRAVQQDPTLLHDDILHSIAAAKRAETTGELVTSSYPAAEAVGALMPSLLAGTPMGTTPITKPTPKKEHLDALAVARAYGIDADLLAGMDDAAISQWNAKRRDTSGIRPDLFDDLRGAHPDEINQRLSDLDSGNIPQHLLNDYTNKATEKFLELQETGGGMSPQDMANVAHNHALSNLRSRIRPRSNEELLKALRRSEENTGGVEPPARMRLDPKQFAGLTETAIAQSMAAEGLDYVATTSNVPMSSMLFKKGRKPKSGADDRPLYARQYPDLDVEGLPEDLKSRLNHSDPDVISAAIDELHEKIKKADALGVTVPELLGQQEKTSSTGYANGDLKRMPSKHYVKDPHTGSLTPHGISTGGVSQMDIDALNNMGTVDVLSEDDPNRVYTDRSGNKHVMTHVFTPNPNKITLIPGRQGHLTIQHRVTQTSRANRKNPDLPTSINANADEHFDNLVNMTGIDDYSGSEKRDTRAAAAANIPTTPLEQRKATAKAMGIDEKAKGLVESDAASQVEVQRALFDAKHEGSKVSPQFKPVINEMAMGDARFQVWNNIFAKDDIRSAAREQDPVYQQDLADYQAHVAKMRENPMVSGIENLREAAGSVDLKSTRLAKEASNLVQRGIPHDQVLDFLKTSHESSPVFEGIGEEHHPAIKGLALGKLQNLHPDFSPKTGDSGITPFYAEGYSDVFEALRKRLPEDSPLRTAIGSSASGTIGQVIDENLIVPTFESWRKPRLQARSTEAAVAGMNRGGEIEAKVEPTRGQLSKREAELDKQMVVSRAEADRLIAETPQRVKPVRAQNPENLPLSRPGGRYDIAENIDTTNTPYMQVPRVVGKTPAVFNSPQLSTDISRGVEQHRTLVSGAMQSRSNMARYADNMRKHQSMLAQADEYDRRAAAASTAPKLAAQHSSQASNLRAQAQSHFESTGLHMSPEEHRSNYESLKNQAIEHSRAEGLTARSYAKSAGEAEFFFR